MCSLVRACVVFLDRSWLLQTKTNYACFYWNASVQDCLYIGSLHGAQRQVLKIGTWLHKVLLIKLMVKDLLSL